MVDRTWLVTGVAGFIGSNLLQGLLSRKQRVVGVDNLATGSQANLDEVKSVVGAEAWSRFHFIKGDITDLQVCEAAFTQAAPQRVDVVLHQAALGSVPRSINDPVMTNAANVTGFVNVAWAAKQAGVRRFVYAASSSTYGDHPGLPKVEHLIGKPLSPYAVTKYVNELYAHVFGRHYEMEFVGLRYFNVFGKRQDPDGPYAAVIPRWVDACIEGREITVNGDGETSRDFCFVDNVVQANILAATTADAAALNQVFNVAFGERTTLNELLDLIKAELRSLGVVVTSKVRNDVERAGDVRHSLADISKAQSLLGYRPAHSVRDGLRIAMPWYLSRSRLRSAAKA